ncbi:hypothetical protein DID78_06695 [Candidatus Marinamargulisbacteria bacterium SCGC AG-343-D04]|nr:hypothetical protein DID78_06695 [Candidatus Marinamargulisbacteria bacterium SCGC AG-343-D04]
MKKKAKSESAKDLKNKICEKIYLLEDCMSSVVLDSGTDFTEVTNECFLSFQNAGVHLVNSSESMLSWK